MLSSRQLGEWYAFSRIRPFGERVEWMRFAMIAMVIANVNRGKDQRAYRLEDFMPAEVTGPPAKQPVAEQKAALLQLVAWAKKTGVYREKAGT